MQQALNVDDKSWVASFRDFNSRSTEYDVISKWFEANIANQSHIKVMLCVGFGLGFDLTLASMIKSLTHLTMLDPNKDHCPPIPSVTMAERVNIEIKYIPFEEFDSSIHYDLILFSHVLYYIFNRVEALKKAMMILADQGRIVIFHQTEHGIYYLQKLFGHNLFSYNLNELKRDLNVADITYSTYIIDSVIRINAPTKELCDFILEKNTSDEEYHRLSAYLRGLGALLYHPSGVINISRSLNKFDGNSIDTWSRKLLKETDKMLLNLADLRKIGFIVYGHEQAVSLYGMKPEQLMQIGIKVTPRTGIDTIYDMFAIPIARRVSEVIKIRFPLRQITIIDPFLGSGNQLYHLAKSTQAAAAFGFEIKEEVWTSTVHNFKLLNFDVQCLHDHCTSVSNVIKPDETQQQLFVIHLSPPLVEAFNYGADQKSSETPIPIKSLVRLYQRQFSNVPILFVISISEEIEYCSFNVLLQMSSFSETFTVNLSDHKTNRGCLMLVAKPEESIDRQLTFEGYEAAFDDFVIRTNGHLVMENWFFSYLYDSDINVTKMLCVGAGTANFETMLAKKLNNLSTFHCVEPNIYFIQKFWQNCNSLSVHDKQLFFIPFEDFHYNGTVYDIILFSHSLYYINEKQVQIAKAIQSLLAKNGSVIIFHEANFGPQVELQKTFSVHSSNYNSADLENDLSEAMIEYTSTPLDTTLDMTHRTKNLYNFFLERFIDDNEKEQLDKYFDTLDKIIVLPVVAIVCKGSCSQEMNDKEWERTYLVPDGDSN